MSSKKEIARLFKPDYIGDKKELELTKKLISVANGDLFLKTVRGNHKGIIDIRQTKQQEIFEKINRKIKYNQIVRRFEVFFNQKLNKYTPTYLNNLSNLLTQRSKDYSTKRKQLTLKNEGINIKSIQAPKIRPRKVFSLNNVFNNKNQQNNYKQFIPNINNPYIVSNENNFQKQIIDPKDEEFISYEPKLYYDCNRILTKLNNETQFYYAKDKTYQKVLKNRIQRNLKNIFPKEKEDLCYTSINKKIIWDKIKRSTSYEVLPSKHIFNKNIYSRKHAKLQNINNFTNSNIHTNTNNNTTQSIKHNRNNSELMIKTYYHGRNRVIPLFNKNKLSKTNSSPFYNTVK